MAYPVRSKGSVTWTHPADEPQAATWGWCADHYLADARATDAQRDLTDPPPPGEAYWRDAQADDLLLIPELRGAIQRPRTRYLSLSEVTPCDAGGSPLAWGSATGWWATMHEALRTKVAVYQPGGTVGTAYLRTTDELLPGQAAIVWYKLLAATDLGDDGEPVQRGIAVHLGMQEGVWQYRVDCPDPHRSDTSGGWWTIQRQSAPGSIEVADRVPALPAPTSGQAEPAAEWLMVIPAVGRLLIRSSRSPDWWVYARPGGCWPRAGHLGIRVTGARCWALYGSVDFSDTVTISGPIREVPEHVTYAGEARAKVLSWQDPDGEWLHSYTGEMVDDGEPYTHPEIAIVNNGPSLVYSGGVTGRVYTPIVYALQEVHRTVLGEAGDGEPVDLTDDVEALSITYQEGGRGAVTSLRLRNWRPDDEEESGYTVGHLDGVLRGIGRVAITMAHEYPGTTPDGDTVTLATGWCSRIVWARDDIWPTVELELDDRAWLWADGRGTMYDLPDVTGWDLREAATLLLTHWEVPEADIVWPADYPDDGLPIPWQDGTAAGRFDPATGIAEALDRLCEQCHYRWQVRPDGKVEFRWYPDVSGVAFTLDQDSVTPEDRVELPVAVALDHGALWNTVRVRGRTRWGDDVEARHLHSPSLTDPTSPVYLGRAVHRLEDEAENPEPGRTAARLLGEGIAAGRELTWQTIGRDLWPGDIVEVDVDHLGVASGTRFRITGAVHSWTQSDPVWRTEYSGKILAGGVS